MSLCLGIAWKATVGMPGSQCQLNFPAIAPFPEKKAEAHFGRDVSSLLKPLISQGRAQERLLCSLWWP